MKQSMKLVVLLIMVFTVTVLLGGCSPSASVGVLDVNKVMSESPKVKQFQDELNTKGKELSDKLEKEKPSITPEEYQKRQEAAYGDFLKIKQEKETEIDTTIKQALEQVAKEKKMSVVLYKNSVAQGGIDVTPDVLKIMQ